MRMGRARTPLALATLATLAAATQAAERCQGAW